MNRIVVASAFGGPEVLTTEETATPEPDAGEVRVAVRAIGANPVDYKLYSGAFGPSPGLLRAFGSEASGVVDAVGEGVSDVAVGDEVVLPSIDGPGFADYLIVPASSVLPKPASLSFEEAAGLPVAAGTASHLIAATGLKAGETVLIHAAAGGVGSMAVQLAVIAGARVIGTASQRNHDFVRSLGGEPVEYGPGLLDRVRALAPDGVDVAFDLVGSDEALDVSLAVVADPTRVATIVAFDRGEPGGIKALGGGPGADPGTDIRPAGVREALRLAGEGSVKVEIAETYPLTEVAAAHRALLTQKTRGKIIVTP